jgi:hypothetical protein
MGIICWISRIYKCDSYLLKQGAFDNVSAVEGGQCEAHHESMYGGVVAGINCCSVVSICSRRARPERESTIWSGWHRIYLSGQRP